MMSVCFLLQTVWVLNGGNCKKPHLNKINMNKPNSQTLELYSKPCYPNQLLNSNSLDAQQEQTELSNSQTLTLSNTNLNLGVLINFTLKLNSLDVQQDSLPLFFFNLTNPSYYTVIALLWDSISHTTSTSVKKKRLPTCPNIILHSALSLPRTHAQGVKQSVCLLS